jgi:hypothetical protein
LVRTANDPQDIVRDIGQHLDITQFLRYLAVESYLGEWDGLAGGFGINNFYLYRAPDSGQFHVIPWDKDNTFHNKTYPMWSEGMEKNVLTRQLMSVPELRDYFLSAVLDCADAADAHVGEVGPDGQQPPSWLLNEIDTQFNQIHEAALLDTRKLLPNDGFEWSVELMRQFARERTPLVREAATAMKTQRVPSLTGVSPRLPGAGPPSRFWQSENQWQVPAPESRKGSPATGMNSHE